MTTSGAQELIARLWAQFRPLVDERITTIADLADARSEMEAAVDPTSEEGPPRTRAFEARRTAALEAAHNLSGSLGSYSRPEGSELAARLEVELARDPLDVLAVRRLVGELREVVDR